MAEGRADSPTLSLERVCLAFGGLNVLSEVSLSIAPGELLALIGPNGAGKTSVLNCICGIYRPASGGLRFGNTRIAGPGAKQMRPHAIAQLGIARTFQHGELLPHMTVIENLLVGRHTRIRSGLFGEGLFLRGVRAEESAHREAVERILSFVELERFRHQPVGSLPFGTQKVIGFARALALEPKLLLLDEPSAGLNRDEREDMARFILRIKHELGISILWVEHDMQMVADLAERLYVLNHGEHLVDGPPGVVLKDPRVIEAYLGSRAASAV